MPSCDAFKLARESQLQRESKTVRTLVVRQVKLLLHAASCKNLYNNRPSVIVIARPCGRFPCLSATSSPTQNQSAHNSAGTASVARSVQATALCFGSAPDDVASGKKALKNRHRTVILFLDSTIFSKVPPLRALWAPMGQQACVPIPGKQRPLGLIRAYSAEVNHFTPDDAEFLTAIAREGSIAIENVRAFVRWANWMR